VLFFFTAEETKSLLDSLKLDEKFEKEVNLICIKVILKSNKNEKEKDELYQINKLLKDNISIGHDNKEISEAVKLGMKYGITSLPKVVWADYFGNELKKGNIGLFSEKTSASFQKEARAIIVHQRKREQDLTKQYAAVEKQIKTEREKKEFSPALIAKLQQIAQYDGWEPSIQSKAVLDEINAVAGEEFKKILGQMDDNAVKKEKVIADLNKFSDKYKGLPVSISAQEKIKEINKESEGKKSGK